MENNPIYFNKAITTGRQTTIGRTLQKSNKNIGNQSGFNNILQNKINQNEQLKFSKHASLRLQSRNINLSSKDIDRINKGVNKASNKGVKDSLVLMDNMAFVVSIKNKTVITAVNNNELKDNVFTNIDGAVIV